MSAARAGHRRARARTEPLRPGNRAAGDQGHVSSGSSGMVRRIVLQSGFGCGTPTGGCGGRRPPLSVVDGRAPLITVLGSAATSANRLPSTPGRPATRPTCDHVWGCWQRIGGAASWPIPRAGGREATTGARSRLVPHVQKLGDVWVDTTPIRLCPEHQGFWCERGDLNPHGLRHTPLKRACLPVPALSQGWEGPAAIVRGRTRASQHGAGGGI